MSNDSERPSCLSVVLVYSALALFSFGVWWLVIKGLLWWLI